MASWTFPGSPETNDSVRPLIIDVLKTTHPKNQAIRAYDSLVQLLKDHVIPNMFEDENKHLIDLYSEINIIYEEKQMTSFLHFEAYLTILNGIHISSRPVRILSIPCLSGSTFDPTESVLSQSIGVYKFHSDHKSFNREERIKTNILYALPSFQITFNQAICKLAPLVEFKFYNPEKIISGLICIGLANNKYGLITKQEPCLYTGIIFGRVFKLAPINIILFIIFIYGEEKANQWIRTVEEMLNLHLNFKRDADSTLSQGLFFLAKHYFSRVKSRVRNNQIRFSSFVKLHSENAPTVSIEADDDEGQIKDNDGSLDEESSGKNGNSSTLVMSDGDLIAMTKKDLISKFDSLESFYQLLVRMSGKLYILTSDATVISNKDHISCKGIMSHGDVIAPEIRNIWFGEHFIQTPKRLDFEESRLSYEKKQKKQKTPATESSRKTYSDRKSPQSLEQFISQFSYLEYLLNSQNTNQRRFFKACINKVIEDTIEFSQNLDDKGQSYTQDQLYAESFKIVENIIKQFCSHTAEVIRSCQCNNEWAIKKKGSINQKNRTRLYQAFGSQNLVDYNQNLSKICIPLECSKNKAEKQRKYGTSKFPFVCTVTTPNSHRVGLVNYPSMGSLFSIRVDTQRVVSWALPLVKQLQPDKAAAHHDMGYAVIVNYFIIDILLASNRLNQFENSMRAHSSLESMLSISIDHYGRVVHIHSIDGNLFYPFIKGGASMERFLANPPQTLRDGLLSGVIDLFDSCATDRLIYDKDSAETFSNGFATYVPETDKSLSSGYRIHDISNMFCMSFITGLIPFSNHQEATRLLIQNQFTKQHVTNTNFDFLIPMQYAMISTEIPLCASIVNFIEDYFDYPLGIHGNILISDWNGMTQEDSIVVNKDFIDRGAFTGYLVCSSKTLLSSNNGILTPKAGSEYGGGILRCNMVRAFNEEIIENTLRYHISFVYKKYYGICLSSKKSYPDTIVATNVNVDLIILSFPEANHCEGGATTGTLQFDISTKNGLISTSLIAKKRSKAWVAPGAALFQVNYELNDQIHSRIFYNTLRVSIKVLKEPIAIPCFKYQTKLSSEPASKMTILLKVALKHGDISSTIRYLTQRRYVVPPSNNVPSSSNRRAGTYLTEMQFFKAFEVILPFITHSFCYAPLIYLALEGVRIQHGDKLTTRHSQKGVVGKIVDSCDLPVAINPRIGPPSIVMNPKGIVKRKSLNLLFEICCTSNFAQGVRNLAEGSGVGETKIGAKIGSKIGLLYDGYGTEDMCLQCMETLIHDNFRKRRCEKDCITRAHYKHFRKVNPFGCYDDQDMSWCSVNPETFSLNTEATSYQLSMGMGYIMSNVNRTLTKTHLRHLGPNDRYNQPTVGKSNNGGHRWGFSERDMTLTSGAASINLDRSLYASDVITSLVCKKCLQPYHNVRCYCGSTSFEKRQMSFSVAMLQNYLTVARINLSFPHNRLLK